MIIDAETQTAFLKESAERYAPSVPVMRSGLKVLGLYLSGNWGQLAQWSVKDVDAYKSWLRARYRAASTVAGYGEFVLGHFLIFAGRHRLAGQLGREYRTRTRDNTQLGLPAEPFEAFISAIEMHDALSVRDRVILELFHRTGPKVSELVDVTLKDIDLVQGRITYRRTGVARSLDLDHTISSLLHEYVARWRPQLESGGNTDRLFLSRSGRPLDRTSIWRRVRHWLGEDFSPNEVRQVFIRQEVQSGDDRKTVIKRTGLSHISQTYIYDEAG